MCVHVCVCVNVYVQLCLTLCDPMDCSLPGSSVHGILQARILEWVAISFSSLTVGLYIIMATFYPLKNFGCVGMLEVVDSP